LTHSADADRWNTRYKTEKRHSFKEPRPFLVENAHFLPDSGLAFDAAMGLGGNTAFLLERGLQVIGVDISEVAVQEAKQRLPGLMAAVADMTHFYLPPATFDVIINFFFLQRAVWPHYRRSLKPGGLLIIETLTIDMLEIQPDIDPVYLLEKGELKQTFNDLDILVYREGWTERPGGNRRATAALTARMPV
jgi:tellurite methyltransferase